LGSLRKIARFDFRAREPQAIIPSRRLRPPDPKGRRMPRTPGPNSTLYESPRPAPARALRFLTGGILQSSRAHFTRRCRLQQGQAQSDREPRLRKMHHATLSLHGRRMQAGNQAGRSAPRRASRDLWENAAADSRESHPGRASSLLLSIAQEPVCRSRG
jgi:hypothetical protein